MNKVDRTDSEQPISINLSKYFAEKELQQLALDPTVSELEFEFNEHVFPPHVATLLVAIQLFKSVKPGMKVLDIGTGAGVFAILSAKLGAKVVATDVDFEAVELARINSLKNSVKVDLRIGSLAEPINQDETFDLIVFNLPSSPTSSLKGDEHVFSGGVDGRYYIDMLLSKDLARLISNKSEVITVQSNLSNIDKTLEKFKSIGANASTTFEVTKPLGERSQKQLEHIKRTLNEKCQPFYVDGSLCYKLSVITASFNR